MSTEEDFEIKELSVSEFETILKETEIDILKNENGEERPGYLRPQQECIDAAKAAGLMVFNFTRAYGRLVSLDLDNGMPEGVESLFTTTSRNGRLHGFFAIPKEKFVDHKAFAKAAGSDSMREDLSYQRWNDGEVDAYLTFETPSEAERLRAWLAFQPNYYRRLVEEL